MQVVYTWIDSIPLSRPIRIIARDFSDGVLTAEVVKHYIPELVELHNYSAVNSVKQKTYNWEQLNTKVFKKLGFKISKQEIDALATAELDSIERLLFNLKHVLENLPAN